MLLELFRNHKRWLMFIAMVLVIPSFVVTGIYSYNRMISDDGAIAKVDDVSILPQQFDEAKRQRLENLRKKIAEQMDISVQEANYLIQTRTVEKEMYSNAADGITLLYPDGSLREVTTVSELINSDSAERKNARHYLFFQRWPTN